MCLGRSIDENRICHVTCNIREGEGCSRLSSSPLPLDNVLPLPSFPGSFPSTHLTSQLSVYVSEPYLAAGIHHVTRSSALLNRLLQVSAFDSFVMDSEQLG